jgi:amidase
MSTETVMAAETVSNLYGLTTNPYNKSLTPGGSSGGESALISMLGSPVGIGTDIAGESPRECIFCSEFIPLI